MFTQKHIEDIKPRSLRIRHHGSYGEESNPMATFWQFSFARGRQIVDQIQEELSIAGGDYEWALEDTRRYSDRENYTFVARYGNREWIEGSGKTPKEALMSSFMFATVAHLMGWIEKEPIPVGGGRCVFQD